MRGVVNVVKFIGVLAVAVGLATVGARAQTVTGTGTTGNLSKFTAPSAIGNSVVVESNGNIGIGTTDPLFPLHVNGADESLTTFGLQPYSIYSTMESHVGFSAAVRGDALATSGQGSGVIGVSYSPDGTGVYALMASNTGEGFGLNGQTNSPDGIGVIGNRPNPAGGANGGGGVRGLTSASSGFSYGTAGVSTANTGSAVAVFGEAWSSQGIAGLFINRPGGDILHGAVSQNPDRTVFRVDGSGRVFADRGFRPFGADFAESVAVSGSSEHYSPGDLLVIDGSGERRLALSQTPYSTLVAGIYSTQPGIVASQYRADEALPKNEVPLAVVGIVPCKVTAENGAIAAGDLLVTSSTPGRAMKGTDRSRMLGAVVGKALEPLQKQTGVIQVLVTLQ